MSHDLLVIGGGAAGMAAARTAAGLGRTVALVQDGPVGGDCTFTGCVPSKTLIEAAGRGVSFTAAMSRVRDTVAEIAGTETADVLRREGIDVFEGRARLTGSRTAVVGTRHLLGGRVVLAAGSAPSVPSLPGLEQGPYLTSDTVWDLRIAPASLAVLGGGAIGCELAQAFTRFGVPVTLLEAGDRLLPKEEPEAGSLIAEIFARDGIDVRLGADVTAVEHQDAGSVRLRLADGGTVQAEHLLIAVGRRPHTAGLGLDAARVAVDDRGWIRVDDRLRTSTTGVYAAGDVTGGLQFTHAADEMGRTAAFNALRRPLWLRYRTDAVPWVTFTSPEVARVGMTEHEAAAHGGRVCHLPMSAVDRAVTAGARDGFLQLITGPRWLTGNLAGGRILGATIVAERAGEMIHEIALGMRAGMLAGRLAQTVHAYPTWSVGVRMAAAQLFSEQGGRRAGPAQRAAAVRVGSRMPGRRCVGRHEGEDES